MGYRHVDNLGAAPRDHHRRYADMTTSWRGDRPVSDPSWSGSRGSRAIAHVERDAHDDVGDNELEGMTIVYV